MQRLEWFKRKFTFDSLPLWMYPNVVERLRGVPARLEDLTRDVSTEILTRRESDKWSMQEHAGHLLDLEPLGMSRLDDYEAGRD
ncbi:MAG: DinB family protein, partial [Acidobacteria bacterium]|nr:DinB family protein [Acidobacteriota bacterium]